MYHFPELIVRDSFQNLNFVLITKAQWTSTNFQSVAQKSERIKEEEIKCQAMADVAQADLNEALPALEEANKVRVTFILMSWIHI